jgi:hypothetical protein
MPAPDGYAMTLLTYALLAVLISYFRHAIIIAFASVSLLLPLLASFQPFRRR